MRNIKEFSVDVPTCEFPPVREHVSYGIAIRERTWTGFGKRVVSLGFDDDESRDSESAANPNMESVGFVESIFENEDDGKENEEAE